MKNNKNIFILLVIILLNATNSAKSKEIKEKLKLFSSLENEIISNNKENINKEGLDLERINNEIKDKSTSGVDNFYFKNSLKKEYKKNYIPKKENNFNLNNKPLSTKLKIQIKKSNKIKYPNRELFLNSAKNKNNLTILSQISKNSKNKTEKSNKFPDSEVYIEKSNKIHYPNTYNKKINKTSKETSLKNKKFQFIYYIKVYPNYKNDNFSKLFDLKVIQKDKDHVLIGPILKDNLGIMTQIVKTKGYNLVEYIKNKI